MIKIPNIKAAFERDGDELYLRVIGDGEATINFSMDVDDNLITSGLAASEIRIDTMDQSLTLKRTPGKEREVIRGSAQFVGGKKYLIKIIGGSPTSGFKTIDKTTVGIDDDIMSTILLGRGRNSQVEDFDENIAFKITSVNPKSVKIPVDIQLKQKKEEVDLGVEKYVGEHVIIWKHIEFPVSGSYQIDVAADHSVRLYIGNNVNSGDRFAGNGLYDIQEGGDENIIEKKGINISGSSTGMSSYIRRFEKGFYRIRAELTQEESKALSKGNPMGLAVKIKIINPVERVVSDASWQENPMGFAVVIDAPDPPIPQEDVPKQQGRCPDNPIWTTRFPNAKKNWYPVYDTYNPSRWSKFMNRYAISPFMPLSEDDTDNGGDPRFNTWTFEAPYDGYYGIKGNADNMGRIIVTDKKTNDVKAILQTSNYKQESGDSFYNKIPPEGIGRLYYWREKNPKTHTFYLIKGTYKIRVDVENGESEIKERVDKVIFNTADWVTEPKKIDTVNVNFEKFGQWK